MIAVPFSATLPLLCHPDTPCPALRGITVSASLADDGSIVLAYRLHGQLEQLLIAPPLPAAACSVAVDGLWQHTCCEAFIATPGRAEYCEYNLAPSGQWAAYAFSDYRQRQPAELPPPLIAVEQDQACLTVKASLPGQNGKRLELALSVVVECRDGSRSYWALAHPPGQPDFHQRSAFTLHLSA